MTEDELNYMREMEDRVRRYEARLQAWRFLTMFIGLFVVVGVWNVATEPKCLWVPNYKKEEIVLIRHKLFHDDYVVRCSWQKNQYGRYGWCAKDPQGKWFIFACDEIWQAMHDYPNPVTGIEEYPHETDSAINKKAD